MSDRILTVKNPWADAIIHRGKDVECRKWSTDFRGRVWIHAGKSYDYNAPYDLLHSYAYTTLPTGCIIGSVDLVDVVTDSESEWAQPGCFHWVLVDPEPIVPFRFTGALGLRRFDASALFALVV